MKYTVNELVKFDYSEIKQYNGEGYSDTHIRNDELVDLLNNQRLQLNKLLKKYDELHHKIYERDFFDVEPADEYTADSRKFQNGLCVFNNRLGMAYSVTEIVEVLNHMTKVIDEFESMNKGKYLEKPLKQEEGVDNLLQYRDSWEKIEENVIEFYAIMLACSDHHLELRNYSSIDEIIQADDFGDNMKDYRKLAKQRICFNSSGSDGE